ncbi:TetR/AcrR family transcriptional regulator [Isoptericola aurantiacus]|uniref:TetR/AcrR family transcriptional regulator n=1 Tax=Isoptericola aurantiacus TaxID=3377839 RepID=UPI00383AE2F8
MPIDRRAAAKSRTRRAIVDAAADLMGSRGATFSVDELAAGADVARRTVFNHFDSLDDVVAAVGADAFRSLVDTLERLDAEGRLAAAEHDRSAAEARQGVLADLVATLRGTDLVHPTALLCRAFGLTGPDAPPGRAVRRLTPDDAVPQRVTMLLLRSLADVSNDLADRLARRHPDAARMDVDLTVAALVSQLVVLVGYWLAETGGATDAASVAVWDGLLDHLTPQPRPGEH